MRFGLGCAPLAGLYEPVSDDDARATIDAAWDAGIRFFDTAPLYGSGLSERRVGEALRVRPRDEYTLSSKVCLSPPTTTTSSTSCSPHSLRGSARR